MRSLFLTAFPLENTPTNTCIGNLYIEITEI